MLGFLRELGHLVSRSDLFFMAGAITFNVLVAFIPLLVLVAGISGMVVSARMGYGSSDLLNVVVSYLPVIEGSFELTQTVSGALEALLEERTGFTVIGALVLLWISTRMVGTLRVVLRDVFELETDRGILRGKLFDLQVVFFGGLLLVLNVGLTFATRALEAFGIVQLGLEGGPAAVVQTLSAQLLSFASAWILFYLLYKYIPARGVAARTAAIGATFTALMFEVMKEGFAWYATEVATYSNAYGGLATAAVLFFWIYYSAVVFILGGQVARAYEIRRELRMARQGKVDTDPSGTGTAALALALLLAFPAAGAAQAFAPFGGNGVNGSNGGLLNGSGAVVMGARSLERDFSVERPLVEHDGPYVVVHVAESRVFVLDGTDVIWSSPAGTGHGFQLEGQGRNWTFTTPVGMFEVRRKEKDPVWIAPDWYYVQRNIPIPAHDHPSRFIAGTLGTSALFLGDGIAIHGTDRPGLLLNTDPDARRVSHGCIRLTNEAARELFHMVDVGTPVLVF